MKLLDAVRDRLSPSGGSANGNGGNAHGAHDAPPFDGYDKLKTPELVGRLANYSQAELTAIDAYEQAHEARPEVLGKLRYLRGDEPLGGYDKLDADGAAAALQGADADTLDRTREYERKFQRRQPVLDELAKVRRRLRSRS